MAGTLQLGSIPSLSVWQGEVLSFKVKSKLGDGVAFSKRALPAPNGELTLDSASGEFKYTPATADQQEFTVSILAQKGQQADEQQFVITPRPRLNPEFRFIRHLSDLPDRSDRIYVTYAEEDAGKAIFNNTADFEDKDADKVKIDTKTVSLSGIRIILEANNSAHPYFDLLDDKTNLQTVTICADEVVIRSPLRLPGTDVYIYARLLSFEGGADGGLIDTSPRAVTIASQTREEGLKGQRAGGVHLYAGKIDTGGRHIRIQAVGANGQPAREGIPGDPGDKVEVWNGKAVTETWGAGHEELNWAPDFHMLNGYQPVYAQIWEYYPAFLPKPWQYRFEKGTQKWPSDGKPPKKLPGRPGQGGDSGAISVGKFEWIEGLYFRKPGDAGKMAQDIKGSSAGTPVKSCHVRAKYEKFMIPSTDKMVEGDGIANRKRRVDFEVDQGKELKFESKDGPPAIAPGPNPNTPFGKEGAMVFLAAEKSWFWLHKAAVRALIPYIHDAMLAGHAQTKEVRDLVAIYRDATTLAAKQSNSELEWSTLSSELIGLLERMDSPYDYYGNPAGWVPMLSFQTNLTLFDKETEDALRILFLVHWIEKVKNKEQKATKTLTAAIEALRKESGQAEKVYEAANAKIAQLELECGKITTDIKEIEDGLVAFEKDLKRIVAEDLRTEHILRGGAKILGGILQLVPVGQPVLGAFGKAGVALADIDLEKPMGVAPGVLKAFAPVVQKGISKKVSDLMEKAKDGTTKVKKETEKEKEFKKEVAKSELKKEVSKHFEEKDEAKSEIVEAFSSMAVKDSEIEERLAQVVADCPQIKEYAERIEKLNARKKIFVEQLLSALQTVDEAATVILTCQLAIIEMRGERDQLMGKLSNGVLQYAQGMGERARRRLLKYQYYLLKSYHYLMLRDTAGIDFRALKLFNAFASMMDKTDNGALTDEQLKTLKTAFRDQVKEDIVQIIDMYQGNAPSLRNSFDFSLTQAELDILNNSSDNRLEIDLMQRGGLNPREENMRITNVEVKTVVLASPPAQGAVTVNLEFFHDGTSKIRRFGQQFLFRSGDYSVAPEAGAGNEGRGGQTAHRLWGAKVGYEEGTQTVDPMIPDPAAGSLLRHLIGDENRDKESALYFRPAAWSGLRIQLSTIPLGSNGSLKKLTLKVTYVSDAVTDSLGTVLVRMSDDARPLVRCDTVDLNACHDGEGTFLRTFSRNTSPVVTFSVAARHGGRDFRHWRIVGTTEVLVTDRSLKLDLNKARAYTVEPVYAQQSTVVADQQTERWPRCTEGWQSVDWILVNNSKDAIRIMEVDGDPFQAPPVKPAADVPVGTNIAKMSFERLEIKAGERVRLSICTNPKDPVFPGAPLQLRSFWEKTNGGNYTIYFTGTGKVESRRKNFDQMSAENEISVDAANRILTFL